MGAGRFCSKHNEYSHSGECRWCEPFCEPMAVGLKSGMALQATAGKPMRRGGTLPRKTPVLQWGGSGFAIDAVPGPGSKTANCRCGKFWYVSDTTPWYHDGWRHSPSNCSVE